MSRVTQNPTEPPPVSSMIDNIEMVREIGRGGFGRVFLVKDEAGMYYALKKIPHDKSEHYGKELSALKLYHKIKDKIPNLIPILDIKINNLEISYIMPLADGVDETDPAFPEWRPKTLTKLIAQKCENGGIFSAGDAINVFSPIFKAAEALNKEGIIHRDIKPDNILFLNGEPFLSDIGLMKEDDPGVSSAGTPTYTPPTWYTGNPDMWGLAATLYFFLTQNPPDTIGRAKYIFPKAKDKMSPADIAALRHFHRVILRAMRENATERFIDMHDFFMAFSDIEERNKQSAKLLDGAIAEKSTSIFLTSGRIDRKTFSAAYWFIYIITNIFTSLLVDLGSTPTYAFVGIFFIWPMVTILSKRAHDANISAKTAICILIASRALGIANAYFFYDVENFVKLIAMLCIELFINIAIFAIFLSFKPTNGINKYGVCAQKLSFF